MCEVPRIRINGDLPQDGHRMDIDMKISESQAAAKGMTGLSVVADTNMAATLRRNPIRTNDRKNLNRTVTSEVMRVVLGAT